MAVPVLAATLTIIASFLPLTLLTGACGEFIRALPIAVAVALSVSFVVAMMLTPLINGFFIKKGLHDPVRRRKRRRNPRPWTTCSAITTTSLPGRCTTGRRCCWWGYSVL